MDEPGEVKIKGIFSKVPPSAADGVKSSGGEEHYWLARELGPGRIMVSPLDENFVPHGPTENFPAEEFMHLFRLEPEVWYRQVSQRLARGDSYRHSEQYVEARIEYSKVLAIDEDNIRANFGMGLIYLAMNELTKAGYVFTQLVSLDEAFRPEHKHLFNEFGIALRKREMFPEAGKYYGRALELSPDDENLHLNLARTLFEKGDIEGAFAELRQGLAINPGLSEGRTFLLYLYKKGRRPGSRDDREFFSEIISRMAEEGGGSD